MSYSAIFKGGGFGCPHWARLFFAFRKAIRWRFTAEDGRCAPEQWRRIEIEDLPISAYIALKAGNADLECHGFRLFGITRSDMIGLLSDYESGLISEDRTTVCTFTAMRLGLGSEPITIFITRLRSDLVDGTILMTMRGMRFPSYMIRPHHRVEMLPETTKTAELVQRHRERLSSIPAQQLAHVPNEQVAGYLLKNGKGAWEDLMATGLFRKLSGSEVARIKDIQFDFE